ncbi:USP6 N-terminal-like protein [Canis lupus familiaris]|uniref:USP6 N-terminal-like protein n=1 Tax=Canis lupus familiaris TaxID=9615 RepID=UPI0015F1C031|nr:USP6 N-terminal-like protein [Canis lupus familiaris]XP_038475206.1 USP6 N-terminal-like protein [Canis lupus familiaris]XP_038475215.1 USP6 N-terminal-like protein [Canis lupus familiaris]XP_038531065.1 USP6 N-terminal-like protein [Canis lupus familiaris]
MQEDLETLLALERADIIAQYHQARQGGYPRDLSLWKVMDHQGLLQEKELPGLSPHKAKKHHQETQRVDKWLTMLRKWGHYHHSEKLCHQVYKGVLPQVWGQVWLHLLEIENPEKYQEMKEEAQVSSWDINRTFHNHTTFWDRYGVG